MENEHFDCDFIEITLLRCAICGYKLTTDLNLDELETAKLEIERLITVVKESSKDA